MTITQDDFTLLDRQMEELASETASHQALLDQLSFPDQVPQPPAKTEWDLARLDRAVRKRARKEARNIALAMGWYDHYRDTMYRTK